MSNDAPRRALAEATISVVAHPPERHHRRWNVPAQAGGCCTCCCCCCLHSLGSIIGAAVAPNFGRGNPSQSYLPLLHYWEEEEIESRPWNTAAADPQAVTARDASAPPPPPLSLRSPAGPLEIVRPMSGPSSVSLFWWILLGLVGVGIVFSLAYGPPGLLIGGVIILLVLPGLQLLSGVVVMFVLLLSARLDRSYQLWQLGKIFLGVLAGAGAGFAIMWLLYIGFSHH